MTNAKTAAASNVTPIKPAEPAGPRFAAMSPEDVKEARAKLGLTQAELADALELEGNFGKDTVRNWERGKRPISGPARVAIRLMVARAGFGKPAKASKLGGINEPTMKAPAK
jgi:DNA-binding transcriptional regulator YiaG